MLSRIRNCKPIAAEKCPRTPASFSLEYRILLRDGYLVGGWIDSRSRQLHLWRGEHLVSSHERWEVELAFLSRSCASLCVDLSCYRANFCIESLFLQERWREAFVVPLTQRSQIMWSSRSHKLRCHHVGFLLPCTAISSADFVLTPCSRTAASVKRIIHLE